MLRIEHRWVANPFATGFEFPFAIVILRVGEAPVGRRDDIGLEGVGRHLDRPGEVGIDIRVRQDDAIGSDGRDVLERADLHIDAAHEVEPRRDVRRDVPIIANDALGADRAPQTEVGRAIFAHRRKPRIVTNRRVGGQNRLGIVHVDLEREDGSVRTQDRVPTVEHRPGADVDLASGHQVQIRLTDALEGARRGGQRIRTGELHAVDVDVAEIDVIGAQAEFPRAGDDFAQLVDVIVEELFGLVHVGQVGLANDRTHEPTLFRAERARVHGHADFLIVGVATRRRLVAGKRDLRPERLVILRLGRLDGERRLRDAGVFRVRSSRNHVAPEHRAPQARTAQNALLEVFRRGGKGSELHARAQGHAWITAHAAQESDDGEDLVCGRKLSRHAKDRHESDQVTQEFEGVFHGW